VEWAQRQRAATSGADVKAVCGELLAIAWPPYRKRREARRGWLLVSGAVTYVLTRPDFDLGDYAAGKILTEKLNELNR